MAPKKGDANSGFWAFWSSLPGILTGIAAVIAAVGADSESTTGGDKHVWQDSAAARIRLDGRSYDLTANGAGNRIRIAFVDAVP